MSFVDFLLMRGQYAPAPLSDRAFLGPERITIEVEGSTLAAVREALRAEADRVVGGEWQEDRRATITPTEYVSDGVSGRTPVLYRGTFVVRPVTIIRERPA